MLKTLHCTRCQVALSRPVALLSSKAPGVMQPPAVAKQPLLPAGQAFKSWRWLDWFYLEEGHVLAFTPQVWMNLDDLLETVFQTKKIERLGGCCGVSGIDGPTHICRCGSEVGTEQSDCFTPLVFIAQHGTTELRDAPHNETLDIT